MAPAVGIVVAGVVMAARADVAGQRELAGADVRSTCRSATVEAKIQEKVRGRGKDV